MSDRLKQLTAVWYSLMVDHHKDRDCHFYIEADYKYDGQVIYSAVHQGYIIEDADCDELNQREFDTQGEAEAALCDFLREHIRTEATQEWNREHFPDACGEALARIGPPGG